MKKGLCGGLVISWLSMSSGAAYVIEQSPLTWKGLYGGIVLSYEWAFLKDAAKQLPTKANPKGMGYGLNLGLGTTLARALYLGGDLDLIISNASWNAMPVSGTTGVFAKARQIYTFQLTGQLGIPLRAYMLYGGVGGGWSKYTGSISIGSTHTDLKGTTSGVAWNVGLKHQIQGIMFDFRFTGQPGSYTIKTGSKIKVHAYGARLGILYVGNF